MKDNLYDITIIGGGPVGMFAAFYAGLRNVKVKLIDSLAELGGQVNALYPEKEILDVAGYPRIKGADLVKALHDQMAPMDVDVQLGTPVTNVVADGDHYVVETADTKTVTKTVVLATGAGAFEPRQLMVDNVADFEANGQIVYSVQNLADFKDKTVMIAGGGNSAIDNALLLEKVAKKVILVHRRNAFRGLEKMVERLNDSTVDIKTPHLIKQLVANDNQLSATIKNTDDESTDTINVDKILVNFGFKSSNKVMKNWDPEFNESHRMLEVDRLMKTNVDHIYAIGDVATYEGKDTLIATGFGEAPIAINHIIRTLYPDRKGEAVHSTALGK